LLVARQGARRPERGKSMNELASPALSAWQSFYVIIGSSAAALIGMQFVVITLVGNMRKPVTTDVISAFATPTVVHLTSVLLVSLFLSVPWPSLFPMSMALAMCGVGGLVYGVIVIHRTRRQTYYQPEREDWIWYTLVPSSIYAAITIVSCFLLTATLFALFAVGAAALGLLLIGIRNAWDTVTHIVVFRLPDDTKEQTILVDQQHYERSVGGDIYSRHG